MGLFASKTVEDTNEIHFHRVDGITILFRQLKSPLLVILLIATTAAFFLGQKTDAAVIATMIAVSVILGFWNEYQAERTVSDLLRRVSLNAIIIKNGVKQEIPAHLLKIGDEVLLTPGSVVPADLDLQTTERLEIDESVLSGESVPVEKDPDKNKSAFSGTVVTAGTGTGKVVAIGKNTKFGRISLDLAQVRPQTEFQKGVTRFGLLVVRVIAIMTVVIFVGNTLLGRSPIEALLFALSIAIGLTPELMPVVVTVSLSHGARLMAKKEVLVKRLVAIEDLGNMKVLCTDKTGTLTEGSLSVHSYQNLKGEESDQILDLALMCNSAIVRHKVFGDAIDTAIWHHAQTTNYVLPKFQKLVEEPFDFNHRAMFVVVEVGTSRKYIYKGAPEEVIRQSKLSAVQTKTLLDKFHALSNDGLRVIAVAEKTITKKTAYDFSDADKLTFAGFITFLDRPKTTVKDALIKLATLGVQVKIITGDNELVTRKICSEVGMVVNKFLLGTEVDNLPDDQLQKLVWQTDVFARMSPEQKVRVIKALQFGDHEVGYLGDGINDGPALQVADSGISVNSAVDVAKDAASIVLLRKSLGVIADGILEGRKIFNNTIKYVLMETSSNFGNMFSAAGASFLLPFLPMTPSQILLTNGLYDVSQLTIPSDNVDPEAMVRPRKWDVNLIKRYMVYFGPISSMYDFLTFGIMLFVFKIHGAMFQTGWFIESLITEIMVVLVIRTTRPVFKSRPSAPLLVVCIGVIIFGVWLPFSPLAPLFSFAVLPVSFFLIILFLTLTYLILVEIAKHYIVKDLYTAPVPSQVNLPAV